MSPIEAKERIKKTVKRQLHGYLMNVYQDMYLMIGLAIIHENKREDIKKYARDGIRKAADRYVIDDKSERIVAKVLKHAEDDIDRMYDKVDGVK